MTISDLHAVGVRLAPTPLEVKVEVKLEVKNVKKVWKLFEDAGERWVNHQCYRMGASLSYYALFSIFPLLLLAITALGFVVGADGETRAKVVTAVTAGVSAEVHGLVQQTLDSMSQHQTARGVGAVIGFLALLFGASAVFGELDYALNLIWKVPPAPSEGVVRSVVHAVRDKAFSFALVVMAALVLIASLVAGTTLEAIGGRARDAVPVVWYVLEAGVSLLTLTFLLAAVFRIVPRAKVLWRDVLPGALFTALLFFGMKRLLAWYLSHIASYAAYGAVGGALALLTWIYLVSLMLLFGAELSRVFAERHGSLAGAPVKSKEPRDHVDESGEQPQGPPHPHPLT